MDKPSSNMSAVSEPSRRGAVLVAIAIMGVAITGYFVSMTSPMNSDSTYANPTRSVGELAESELASNVIRATDYAQMPVVAKGPNANWATQLSMLKQPDYDPFEKIEVSEEDKVASLASRAELRAFNGAPPTVPHTIDQMTVDSCMACHAEGLKTETLRAAKMPHPFLTNCTQCHVEKLAQFTDSVEFGENSFVGLAAPTSGSRAFASAPPVVPHSTWMRNDCLSCHGRTASAGMEATHPWRQNCLQCHAPSATLNQVKLESTRPFLPPPEIDENDER